MHTVLLAILAGGEGSRMGLPKAELRINGKPILEHLLNRWNWTAEKILITAPGREHPPAHELFDREIPDPIPGQGPLRGIVTALEHASQADALIVTTCDMPHITREMLDHLTTQLLQEPSALGVMTEHGDKIEPFPFAVRPSALPLLQERLAGNARSLHSLARLESFRLIPPPPQWDEWVWTNLNTPDDLTRAGEQKT